MYASRCLMGGRGMLERREFMKVFSAAGFAGTLLPGVLWAQAQGKSAISKEMIDDAAKIASIAIADEYKEMLVESLNEHGKGFDEIFALHMANSAEPALLFVPDMSGAIFCLSNLTPDISGTNNRAGSAEFAICSAKISSNPLPCSFKLSTNISLYLSAIAMLAIFAASSIISLLIAVFPCACAHNTPGSNVPPNPAAEKTFMNSRRSSIPHPPIKHRDAYINTAVTNTCDFAHLSGQQLCVIFMRFN